MKYRDAAVTVLRVAETGARGEDVKARGVTQEAAAAQIEAARTTLVAIEKAERRIRPAELVRLAAFYRWSVGALLRTGEPVEAFAVQLRAAVAPRSRVGE